MGFWYDFVVPDDQKECDRNEFALHKRNAESGSQRDFYWVMRCYLHGYKFIAKDYREAIKFAEKCAECTDNYFAPEALGDLYLDYLRKNDSGLGERFSYTVVGQRWLNVALKRGSPTAMGKLKSHCLVVEDNEQSNGENQSSSLDVLAALFKIGVSLYVNLTNKKK